MLPGNGDDSESVAYRAMTPMAGLLYRVSPVTSVYANFGRGFETPTFAELAYLEDPFFSTVNTVQVPVPAGNVLPSVPRSVVCGELRWRHRESGFTAIVEALGKSKVAVDDRNSDFAEAYASASLALGFTQETKAGRISEYLRIDNIADKRYIGSVVVNDANARFFEPAPGRNESAGIQARWAF